MSNYEFDFIATSGLSESEVENLMNSLVHFFDENEAKVLKKEYWGLIDFKYKILKNTKGHYFMFYLEVDPSKLKEIERKLSLNSLILRHMKIKITPNQLTEFMKEDISLKLA